MTDKDLPSRPTARSNGQHPRTPYFLTLTLTWSSRKVGWFLDGWYALGQALQGSVATLSIVLNST